ncbi:MAG: nucleotidyltransferase domain-containing protein [Candidatus Desantisbacteria bacterium]
MKYGLSDKQLNEIISLLGAYPEIEEAILFGSRAIDTYKEASDVDIAIKGEKATASLAAKLKYYFEEETYLPFFFDFVAYPTITNAALREHINTKGVSIYRVGWKECRLGEVVRINYGKGLPEQKRKPGSVPVFSSAGITGWHNIPLVNNKGIIIGSR